jgi:hypothetical protein
MQNNLFYLYIHMNLNIVWYYPNVSMISNFIQKDLLYVSYQYSSIYMKYTQIEIMDWNHYAMLTSTYMFGSYVNGLILITLAWINLIKLAKQKLMIQMHL